MRKTDASAEVDGKLRLLLVDDDETDRRWLRRCLHEAGISATVHEAASAQQTMESVESNPYDCLLLDYYLPDTNHLALVQNLLNVAEDLPIVMLTGRGDEDLAVELMKAGVADYIPKASVTPERLAAGVRHARALCRAAAAQRRAEAELRAREKTLHTLANAIPQLAWMADPAGARTWFNQRWYDYTGTTFEEVRGWGWQKLHHPDHVDNVLARMLDSLATGEKWEQTHPLRGKDGSYRWFLSRAEPIRNADGKVAGWVGTNTDITQQLEAEQALREGEERFRRALAIETVGVIYFDIDGAITEANDAFLRMTGFTRDELTAGLIRWDELTPPEWMPRSLQAVEEFTATGKTTPYEKEYFNKQGDRWWALFAATRLGEREGVEFIIDISARKEAEKELRRATAIAKEAAAAKSRFLAATTHDLRQPLQLVMMTHDLLERELRDPKLGSILQRGERAAARLARAFEMLDEIARLDSGIAIPKRQTFPIEPLLREIADSHEKAAQERGLRLSVAPCGERVNSDREMLGSILQNLVGNAIKYTERGGVTLACTLSGDRLLIDVRDTGIGIPADKLEAIFHEYERLDPASSEGMGLGLAIVTRLAELLGHRISVESELGAGSRFRVEVPRAPQRATPPARQPNAGEAAPGQLCGYASVQDLSSN